MRRISSCHPDGLHGGKALLRCAPQPIARARVGLMQTSLRTNRLHDRSSLPDDDDERKTTVVELQNNETTNLS
jgi:hypothetical protein